MNVPNTGYSNFPSSENYEFPPDLLHSLQASLQSSTFARPKPSVTNTKEDQLFIIGSASKGKLLASENAAFLELFEENIRLKAQLELKSETRSDNTQKPATASRALSSTQTSDFPLVIPPSPPECDQADFPDVGFWSKDDWRIFTQDQHEKGRSVKKLHFITQEDGTPVSDERLAAMSKEARALYATLYYKHLDPNNWGNKPKICGDFFSNSMREKFPELRWCKNDWKVEAFASIRYSEWKAVRASGTLLRQTPSVNVNNKRKAAKDSVKSKPLKKRKQAAESDIVEMSDTLRPRIPETGSSPDPQPFAAPSTSSNPQSHSNSSSAPQPTEHDTDSTSPSTSSPSATIQELTSPSSVPQHSAITLSSPPIPEHGNSSSASSPSPSVAALPEATCSSGSLPPQPTQPTATTSSRPQLPERDAASTPASARNISSVVTSLPEIQVPIESHVHSSAVPSAPAARDRLTSNILSNITIPTLNEDLLAPISNNNSTSATTNAPNGPAARLDRFIKDNGTLTARNLYAIDYVKENGPTLAAAFKTIWDNLDSVTAKKYKALSSAAKKNSKSAPKPST